SFLRAAKEAAASEAGDPAPDGSAAAHRYGFDKPALTASWVTPQQKMQLVVGNAKPGTNARWVRTEESPVAYLVASDLLAPAKGFADIAAKPPAPLVAGTAATLTKSTGGGVTVNVKTGS